MDSEFKSNPHVKKFLKKHFGKDKTFTTKDVSSIIKVAKHKFQYFSWIVRNVEAKNILPEDVYKYEEYFEIFEKNKNKYPAQDINHYGKTIPVDEFSKVSQSLRDLSFTIEESSDDFIGLDDIEKLTSVGIIYHGICHNYQVFELPSTLHKNKEAWKQYRNILGKSAGGKIDFCTMANMDYFDQYYKNYKGSSYFVLYNYSDQQSPYQFHYESTQFMDRNDKPVMTF
jgi:hypothetical protein